MEDSVYESIDFNTKYEEGKFKLVWRLCLLLCILFALMSAIEYFHSITNATLYLFCASIPGAGLIYLYKTRNSWWAYFGLCFFGSCLTLFSLSTFMHEVHLGDFLWMALIAIMAFWGLGVFWGWFFASINFLFALIYFFGFMEQNFAEIRPIDSTLQLSLAVEMFAAFSSISLIVSQFVKYYRYSFETLLESNRRMKETNRIIVQKNEENTLLIKEVHHRVKNNLQIITSLLRLQKNTVAPEAQMQFEEAIDRIMSMALIHRKLYQSGNFTSIDIQSYIHELINEILRSNNPEKEINTGVITDDIRIGLNTVVPMGLIINELVSNSFKHAFGGDHSANISIRIRRAGEGKIEMTYSDSGTWKIPDPGQVHFGTELIETLTQQLEGTMKREGSSYHFVFSDQDNVEF